MKVLTFELFEEKDGGEVKIFPSSVIPDLKRFRPIGYFELEVRKDFLDITPPKKVVTKEAKMVLSTKQEGESRSKERMQSKANHSPFGQENSTLFP